MEALLANFCFLMFAKNLNIKAWLVSKWEMLEKMLKETAEGKIDMADTKGRKMLKRILSAKIIDVSHI